MKTTTKSRHTGHGPAATPAGERAAALYAITGLGALTTAVGLLLCGRRSRALLVGQWVAPLLLAAVNERIVRRRGNPQQDTSTSNSKKA